MNSKSYCSRERKRARVAARRSALFFAVLFACLFAGAQSATAGDAPAWMHALVNVPLPAHDEKTDALLLYSERILIVQSTDKMRVLTRGAYKILRPTGRGRGFVRAYIDSETKVGRMHGWCIPAQGKDFEAKERDAVEISIPDIDGSELVSDVRVKVLQIPAAEPGNIVGYEYEEEIHPYVLQDIWEFQESYPVREARYTLQLPQGWEYKASWLNYAEVKPTAGGNNQWQWTVSDLKPVKREAGMPPFRGVAGEMVLSIFPSGNGPNRAFVNWGEMGSWYWGLTSGRQSASPEIKQKVNELTASVPAPLDKMRALAKFVQRDIRYVAIELGIGGWQPHPAAEVFTHKYGDCKDKATLMGSLLHEIGVQSYYVVINTERGSITPQTPAHKGFDHAIIAIRLPDGVEDPSLAAIENHPKLGRILFFDPTDELVPFGQLSGALQANYGLLVTSDGGELNELPKLPAGLNGVRRTGKLALDTVGTLHGDVHEVRMGDFAASQRAALRNATRDADKIKPIESLLAHSLTTFQITKATVGNLQQTDKPFEYNYSLVANNYAKPAGNLLLVRPRVLGNKSSAILETKEPRKYPMEFSGPMQDTDTFEITLPPGYEVDELPPVVNADYSFASYHSKTEVNGNVLRYTRTFEVKELTVPLEKLGQLKLMYRIIAGDERNTAVLKPAGSK
jgi:uncharacterized protein DUF3857/transglutaminase superfamily protein